MRSSICVIFPIVLHLAQLLLKKAIVGVGRFVPKQLSFFEVSRLWQERKSQSWQTGEDLSRIFEAFQETSPARSVGTLFCLPSL